MTDPKSILKSKTVWFNVLLTLYNALDTSGLLPAAVALIPPPWGMIVQGVGTVILRTFFTSQPIANPITAPAAGDRITLP